MLLAWGTVLAIERAASACGTCTPAGQIDLADDAAVQPANAGFFVWNVDDPADYVQAWVDGVPAEVERIEGIQVHGRYDGVLGRVVPPPPPGALVEVLGDPFAVCFGREPNTDEPLSFIAGAPDEDVPENLGDPYWDLHDYTYDDMSSCTAPDTFVYVRGDLAAEAGGHAARLLEVEVMHGSQTTIRTAGVAEDSTFLVALDPEIGDVLLEDMCVRVTMLDVAGHRSEPSAWICSPCHAVVDRVPTDELPPEPAWTEAELVEDGYCGIAAPPEPPADSGPDPSDTTGGDPIATTGEDDTMLSSSETATEDGATTSPRLDDGALDRGCACRTRPGRRTGWLLAFPFLFARWGRRPHRGGRRGSAERMRPRRTLGRLRCGRSTTSRRGADFL